MFSKNSKKEELINEHCLSEQKCEEPIQLQDSVLTWIKDSKPARFKGKSRYRYSDLGFMLLQQIGEKIIQTDHLQNLINDWGLAIFASGVILAMGLYIRIQTNTCILIERL